MLFGWRRYGANVSESRSANALMVVKRISTVMVVSLLAVGCGRSGNESGPRPLTVDEASRLSAVTYQNHLQGIARFELFTVADAGGPQVTMRGLVDWTSGSGQAELAVASENSTLAGVAWSGEYVAEWRPNLDQVLRERGVQTPAYVIRAAQPGRRLDDIIRIVAALASKSPDNQLLIRQTEGSSYLRDDELRGEATEVLRYGERSIYWISKVSGALLRFEGNAKNNQLPIVIDLYPTSGESVVLPASENSIDLRRVPDLQYLLNDF